MQSERYFCPILTKFGNVDRFFIKKNRQNQITRKRIQRETRWYLETDEQEEADRRFSSLRERY